jgi:TRAP-type uncharacterized transport system substrate-binding protein
LPFPEDKRLQRGEELALLLSREAVEPLLSLAKAIELTEDAFKQQADAMRGLEQEGFERNLTPAGFLPGIDRPLLAVDESDFLLMTRAEAEDDFVYAVTKVIDQNRKRMEEGAVTVQYSYNQPLPIPQMVVRSPLTGPITEQWTTGAPLHHAAENYYRENGLVR